MSSNHNILGDSIGSVSLLDSMGNDLTTVNAARVSFGKRQDRLSDKDEGLIRYLAKHNHWTPFSHTMVTLHIKMPIFVARQWFKHTVGFTRNEVSRRYVDDAPEFFNPEGWRARPEGSVKQGSGGEVDGYAHMNVQDSYLRAAERCEDAYNRMLSHGVAPEMARMVLPQSTYTEFHETASLYAYARLCALRLDPHAQLEIQQYAQAVSDIIAPIAPLSWKYLTQGVTE